VKDRGGLSLAYVYFEEEPGRRAAAKLLTRDEARRIAANIAKLPQFITKARVQPGPLTRGPRRSEGLRVALISGTAFDLSIRTATLSQVAARAKKASLFSGTLADSPQDRH
jgi:hypothetical protein